VVRVIARAMRTVTKQKGNTSERESGDVPLPRRRRVYATDFYSSVVHAPVMVDREKLLSRRDWWKTDEFDSR
jgi:hypothetical protein